MAVIQDGCTKMAEKIWNSKQGKWAQNYKVHVAFVETSNRWLRVNDNEKNYTSSSFDTREARPVSSDS